MVEFCYFYSSSYCTPYCQNVQEVYNNFVQDVHKKFTRYKKMEKNEPIRQKHGYKTKEVVTFVRAYCL